MPVNGSTGGPPVNGQPSHRQECLCDTTGQDKGL